MAGLRSDGRSDVKTSTAAMMEVDSVAVIAARNVPIQGCPQFDCMQLVKVRLHGKDGCTVVGSRFNEHRPSGGIRNQ